MATQFAREVRVALRRLFRTPVFTAFAVLSLAVGLGVSTAFYSVMSVVLWPGAGLERADRLLVLGSSGYSRVRPAPTQNSRGEFEDFRAAQTSMIDVAAWAPFQGAFVDASTATVGPGLAVTGNTFGLLGFGISSGRAIQPADDTPSAPSVMVLAHTFWLKDFHGEPVVGRIVRVNGVPFEVIGVAGPAVRTIGPARFESPRAWIPLAAVRRFSGKPSPLLDASSHSTGSLGIIGRLKDDVSLAAARAEATAIGERLDRAFPRGNVAREWSLVPADVAFATKSEWMAWTLVGLVSLVLLVAATNVANLTLGRGASRRHELAVRRALGATGWALMREPLIESGAIALAGCGLALIIARAILAYAGGEVPAGVFDIPTTLAPDVIGAALAGAFLALLVFGLWPAIVATRPDVRSGFAGGAGDGATVRWRTRRRGIIGQVAVSAVFLFLAAMCIRRVVSSTANDSGVDVDRLAIAAVSFSANHWEEARAREAAERILSEARRTAGFEAVAIASGLPFGVQAPQMIITTPDGPVDPDNRYGRNVCVIAATPEIFRVLGVPIVRGRGFDVRDSPNAPLAAVVSSLTAKTLFGESSAIGRQVLVQPYQYFPSGIAGGMLTIVGIARDTDSPQESTRSGLVVYLPFAQQYAPSVQIIVRATRQGADAVGPLQTTVRRVEPDLALGVSGKGAYVMAGPTLGLRIMGGVAMTLGAIVLVLAMAGLFGVVLQLVATRTREFGIRQALGATRRDIVRLVLRDGIGTVRHGLMLGLLFGVLGRVLLHRMIPAMLSGIDWLAFVIVPVALVTAALLACYLPARRAASVDASVALRDE